MKLSIIVPVYNSEKYLLRSLQSIMNQDIGAYNYEVIVINDGSSDGSENVVLDLAENFKNLIYVSQNNQGVSAARNAGLAMAQGEYITFIDSDDQIEINSLKPILQKLAKDNLDILYPNINRYSESGEELGIYRNSEKYNEVKPGLLQERRTFPATFYKRMIIRDIRFPLDISFGEDTIFNTKVQSLAERVCFFDSPYYRYTVRSNSLSKQGKSETAFRGFLRAIEEIRHFQHYNFKNDAEGKLYFDRVYEIFVMRIIELNVMPEWNQQRYDELRRLLRQENLDYILAAFRRKYPYVDSSFILFKTFQKYLAFKSKIYILIYRA